MATAVGRGQGHPQPSRRRTAAHFSAEYFTNCYSGISGIMREVFRSAGCFIPHYDVLVVVFSVVVKTASQEPIE